MVWLWADDGHLAERKPGSVDIPVPDVLDSSHCWILGSDSWIGNSSLEFQKILLFHVLVTTLFNESIKHIEYITFLRPVTMMATQSLLARANIKWYQVRHPVGIKYIHLISFSFWTPILALRCTGRMPLQMLSCCSWPVHPIDAQAACSSHNPITTPTAVSSSFQNKCLQIPMRKLQRSWLCSRVRGCEGCVHAGTLHLWSLCSFTVGSGSFVPCRFTSKQVIHLRTPPAGIANNGISNYIFG